MTKASKPTLDALKQELLALTAKVAERIDLLHVWLVESSLKRNPGKTTGLDYTTSTEADSDLARNPDRLFLLEKYSVKAFPRNAKKLATPTVVIQATFLVSYAIEKPQEFSASHYQAFARINGIYNTWPYWREYVQSVTGRMGLPPLTLPVFRLTDLHLKVGTGGRVTAEYDQWSPDEGSEKEDPSKKGA
jgi:hypothetical protein